MKRLCNESGQTLVVAAISLTVMLGFVGFATDMGVQLREKRLVQTAADASAMAAASQLIPLYGQNGLNTNMSTAGLAAATQNGFTNGSGGATVNLYDPPTDGPYAGVSGYVEAVVSQNSPTWFMKAVGTSSMTVTGEAVSTLGQGSTCIYALGTSGIALNGNNSGGIYAPGCGVQDNSNISVVGSANITAQSLGVVGSAAANAGNINNGGSTSPSPTYGVAPVSDPLAYLTPPSYTPSSCTAPPAAGQGGWVSPGSATIGPASGGTVCYNGLTIANGMNVTLNPGTYIINGTMSIQGGTTVTGSNVSFYFPSSGDTLSIANGTTVSLSAPTTGGLAGILFWQSSADTTAINLAGGSSVSLQGTFYAPSAALTLSNNNGTNIYLDLVVNSFTITGSGTLKSYQALTGSYNPFKAVQLVE